MREKKDMEFGKTPLLNDVDWSLPADDPLSLEFLGRRPAAGETQIRLGTPAWGHKEWVGKIYPPGTKAIDYLSFYAKNFATIELNTTHYRIPTAEQVRTWVSKVPESFLFCPKIPQSISHSAGGLTDAAELRRWLESIAHFGPHLGPCFLQLPPTFSDVRKAELFHFLKSWPDDLPLSLELRHPCWFEEGRVRPALTRYLQSRGIGLVITDVAGRRDVLHTSISADFVLLRFIGNNLHESDFTRCQAWSERLAQWSRRGLKEIFFFVHEPDDVSAPEMANQVIRDLNDTTGAGLPPLQWVSC
ncbi:MAG: DUF72 domain-containing protein [Bdellovibrionaceae bacterium]|nr:DUF72 domain-containing protein [Pseudobdellovibrionaceae bacterium]MBX3034712.1 DUF72 domain-containing protein [Pseudobdellovibrionaceae bacterium]